MFPCKISLCPSQQQWLVQPPTQVDSHLSLVGLANSVRSTLHYNFQRGSHFYWQHLTLNTGTFILAIILMLLWLSFCNLAGQLVTLLVNFPSHHFLITSPLIAIPRFCVILSNRHLTIKLSLDVFGLILLGLTVLYLLYNVFWNETPSFHAWFTISAFLPDSLLMMALSLIPI